MIGFTRSRNQRVDPRSATTGEFRLARTLMTALLLVLFLSIYTEVPLVFTETLFVPAFVYVFSIPVLYVLLRRDLSVRDYLFVAQMFGLLVLSVVASPGWHAVPAKLTGVLQTSVSITGGVLLMRAMDRAGAMYVERLLLGLILALVAGAAMERLGIIRDLSDQFRANAYHGYWGAYENLERDLDLVGFERPKLFTSEPSLLALGYSFFVNAWVLLRVGKIRVALAAVLSVAFLALSGSPTVVLSMAVTAMIGLFNFRKKRGWMIVIAIMGIGAAPIWLVTDLTTSIVERSEESASYLSNLEVSSENVRLVFPFITAGDVIANSPLFGTGISGKEVAGSYSSLPYDTFVVIGNNNFWIIFTYFGIVGGGLFFWILMRYIRASALDQATLLALILLCFSQAAGGFETPRIWGYTFVLIGAARLGRQSARERQPAARPVRALESAAT
jgi:hypothetical protein